MTHPNTPLELKPTPREAHLFFEEPPTAPSPVGDSVVCWIDLLGVREGLANAAGSGGEAAFVADYLRVLRPLYVALDWEFQETDYKWNAFTDSIVISVPVEAGHPETTIGLLCDAASEIQFRLTAQGWFARGGVAVGPLHASDQFVVGSGLMEAYQLEGTEAVVPRIIVAESVRKVVPQFVSYYADKADSPQNGAFAFDVDGHMFLNYLYAPLALEGDDTDLDGALERHRKRVFNNLEVHAEPSRIRSKYLWAAAYHNWFCSRWARPASARALAIPDIPPQAFRTLVP